MFEKVNPAHPDKIADRIAGAIVDAACQKENNPRIAVEVLIGHGVCHIIAETSVRLGCGEVRDIVRRIAGDVKVDYLEVPQDTRLSENQKGKIRCGDNGIFKGAPVTDEQKKLAGIADSIYKTYPTDGKYILSGGRLTICQSHAKAEELCKTYPDALINPIGDWTGGTAVGSRVNYLTLSVPASVVPVISGVSLTEATENIAAQFGGFVRAKSRLAVSISASGAQGSTVTGCRTTIEGTAYTQASFTSNTLNTAGDQDISVTVTDSRGRTATTSQTFTVLDWRPPALTRFTAERCNADGSAPQTDGDRVRITAAASVSPVGNKNTMSCKVYYKLSAYTAWTQAAALTPVDYAVNAVNLLLPPTFNALNSYDLKIEVSDFFGTISQQVSIGTKKVMMDFYRDGTGVAFGKVAETSGRVEFAWPVKLSSPLPLADGGTGANSGALACYNLGAVRKSGDTMTGNLNIQGSLYPSLKLLPTYNGTTNNTVFEGSYIGASSFSSWEDFSGNNRRMLEVRTKKYASALDNAVLLRTCDNGQWAQHRVFHAGMETPVPVMSGGTGANNASSARAALGANNAGNLNVGTLPVERLPFKYAYGTATINGVSSVYVSYSNAGFTQIPVVIAAYSTTGANWSGDNGAIKVHDKTIYGCGMIVGGSFNTNRTVDWFAFGV